MVSPDQKLLREHIFQLQNSNSHLEVFHRTLKMLGHEGPTACAAATAGLEDFSCANLSVGVPEAKKKESHSSSG